jgi:serine/threonine protein kinase
MNFDSFHQIAPLGSSFLASVGRYQSHQTKSWPQDIVIKQFQMPTTPDSSSFKLCLRELAVLIQLDHPCLVKLAGFSFASRYDPFRLATVFVEGDSLESVLNCPIPPPWWTSTIKSKVIAGIVLGMKYIHSQGVIHRDLKPSNVILELPNHLVRICDFNLSKILRKDGSQKRWSQLSGTPQYMAPEMYKGIQEGEIPPGFQRFKADIFSFALICYEIIVGVRLYSPRLSLEQIMYKVLSNQRGKIPEHVPTFVQRIIQDGWREMPDDRPTFIQILDILRENRFMISPDCDGRAVAAYVGEIEGQVEYGPGFWPIENDKDVEAEVIQLSQSRLSKR